MDWDLQYPNLGIYPTGDIGVPPPTPAMEFSLQVVMADSGVIDAKCGHSKGGWVAWW